MNKKQLVAKLSGSLNLSKADAERTFDTITNTILDALKNDDSVKIAGFGTYKVAKRKARIGRNPELENKSKLLHRKKLSFCLRKHLKKFLTNNFFQQPLLMKIDKGCFYMQLMHT